MSFVGKIRGVDSVYCMLVKGSNISGQKLFAYVAVHEQKLDNFRRAAKNGNFHPAKIGKVVYSAMGELTAEMHEFVMNNYIKSEGVEVIEN